MTSAISGVVSLFQRKQSFQIYSHSDDKKKTNNKRNKTKKKTKQKSKIDVDFKLEDLVQKNKKEENGKAKVIYLWSFFTGFTMHKFQYRLRAKCFAHFFPSLVKWKALLNKTLGVIASNHY